VGLAGSGLGDVFKSVQYCRYLRSHSNCPIALYPFWHGYRGVTFQTDAISNHTALAREIMGILGADGTFDILTSVDNLKHVVFAWDLQPWVFPYVPTLVRWRPPSGRKYGRVACQLDGRWNGPAKNPPVRDVRRLQACLPGYQVSALGKHLSLKQCVEALATSDLFFGVDSGMLQLAYAVGTPAFLITYRQDDYALLCWHGDKHAVWCGDTDEFIAKAGAFLNIR
jgi:hypothetical protein